MEEPLTVQELIDLLQEVKDKEKKVVFATLNSQDYIPIIDADETFGKVVLWDC